MCNMATNCKCLHDVFLKDKTWIHRGGKVSNYYIPESIEQLIEVGRMLYLENRDFLAVGHTSNLYFKNSFNINSIVDTKQLTAFNILDDKTLVADCGAHMSKLSQYCVENGFVGYQGMINLPGTVGGAIVNNSGCYNCGIDKVLKSIDLLTPKGDIINIANKELGYSFRDSKLKTGELKGVILRAYLDISNKGNVEVLKKIALENTSNRKATQDPPAYNLGTTVNFFHYKTNLKNIFIRTVSKIMTLMIRDCHKRNRTLKKLILFMYDRSYLDKYISDKRMQCFLWKDENSDLYFEQYLELLRDIYKKSFIEIQIKG